MALIHALQHFCLSSPRKSGNILKVASHIWLIFLGQSFALLFSPRTFPLFLSSSENRWRKIRAEKFPLEQLFRCIFSEEAVGWIADWTVGFVGDCGAMCLVFVDDDEGCVDVI